MSDEPEIPMEEVIRMDGRYPPAAFAFLHEGLGHAAKMVYGEARAAGQQHVTGQQLCQALRDLAIERYGQLAQAVLRHWNVRETIDFGNMVYLLIDHKFMRKTDEDSLEDFRDVFDFTEAFRLKDDFELKE